MFDVEVLLMPQTDAEQTGMSARKAAGGTKLLWFPFRVEQGVDDTEEFIGVLICCIRFEGAPEVLMPSNWPLVAGVTVVSSPPPTVSLVFFMASNIISSTFCGEGFSDGKPDLC